MAGVVTTYLELTDPAGIAPARGTAPIERVDPPDGRVNRFFYETIGADWRWTDHADESDAWWQAHAEAVETWVIPDAGYAELHPVGDDVEIAYFGLLPHAQGGGLGGHLLTHALTRAFELAPRAWVHTCTLDGPYALANYEARGLRPFKTEVLGSD